MNIIETLFWFTFAGFFLLWGGAVVDDGGNVFDGEDEARLGHTRMRRKMGILLGFRHHDMSDKRTDYELLPFCGVAVGFVIFVRSKRDVLTGTGVY